MTSNSEHQKAYRKRKRAIADHQEFEQFIIGTPFSSSTTDEEKYALFKSHRQTMKVKERKLKRAEAARHKYKQDKLKRAHEDPPTKRLKRFASDRNVGDIKDPHKHNINDSLFFHVAEKISSTTPCDTVKSFFFFVMVSPLDKLEGKNLGKSLTNLG